MPGDKPEKENIETLVTHYDDEDPEEKITSRSQVAVCNSFYIV